MEPGLGPQGKLEGLCVGSFNNSFGKFVPFLPNKWFSTKCITLCNNHGMSNMSLG